MNINASQKRNKELKAQSMVEFALILPVLLLLLFGILEYGRLFFAWISIENAARIGARYASTGEYNPTHCPDLNSDGLFCDGSARDAEIDVARLASIEDETNDLLFGNPFSLIVAETESTHFDVTICATGHVFVFPDMGGTVYSECTRADGTIEEVPGEPGERVIVSVDYNFPFVVPFFQDVQDYFHLASYKEATVEQFRVSRVVNIPPTIAVPTIPTSTPAPTATPDCSSIRIESLAVAEDNLVASVSNNTGVDMPLTNSQLVWENVGGRNQLVNWFRWNNRTYYGGNDYNSPTNATCSGGDCAFPDTRTMSWETDFNNVGAILYGDFQLDLTFGNVCVISQTLSLAEPAIDCNLLVVNKVWFTGDDFRVRVRNNNPMDVPLTNASLVWPQEPSNAVINFFKWNWKTHYGGNTGDSPYSATCSGDICAFPPLLNRVWAVDFNNIPDNTITGPHEVTLTFADQCEKVVPLGPSCNEISVENLRIGSLDPSSGARDNLIMDVTNDNDIPVRLTHTSFSWTNMFGNGVDWITFGGTNYYDGDSFTSPTTFDSTILLSDEESYVWDAEFTNADGPIYGDYQVDLTFDYGVCTVSDTLTAFTPTASPTPDCTNIYADNLRVGSNVYGNGETDNIKMEVTNNNPTSVFLTNTTFHWTNPFGRGVDWINFGGAGRYYNGDSFTSPTIFSSSGVELPSGATYTWDADFTGWDQIPFSGEYAVELIFDNRCPVSDTLTVASPTPTLTPTVTNTATNTPLPSPTMTPTPTADCDLISANNPFFAGDDVRMNVTNNNPQPIQLTFTTFTWSNYYGNGVNYFRFGGNQYYGGDSYSSPTTRGSSIWLPSGSTYTWLMDFTGYDIPLYGPYQIALLFDGRCAIDGNISRSTPTPSRTPIPTRTLIPSATPTASNTPTSTATFRPTNTPTDTPEPSNTPLASPTSTFCFDC